MPKHMLLVVFAVALSSAATATAMQVADPSPVEAQSGDRAVVSQLRKISKSLDKLNRTATHIDETQVSTPMFLAKLDAVRVAIGTRQSEGLRKDIRDSLADLRSDQKRLLTSICKAVNGTFCF